MSRSSGILLVILSAPAAWTQGPAKQAGPAEQSRVDDFGDPLPAGALRRLGTIRFRQGYVNEMAFMPDGKSLVAVGSDNVIHWDLATGKPLRIIPTSSSGNRRSLGLSRDGRLIAIRPDDHSVVVIDMANGKERFRKKLKAHFPGGVISPDESTIAIGSPEATFLYELNTGREIAQLPGTNNLRFSPDGAWLAGLVRIRTARVDSPGDHIVLFDAKTGQEKNRIRRVKPVEVDGDYLEGFDFTPDGRALLLSWEYSGILIYDLANQKIARHLETDAHLVAISPDSKIVATSKERTIALTNIETGAEVRRWQLPDTILKWARGAFSSDGKTLALGFECGIQFWDPATGRRLDPYRGSVHTVRCLAVSDDGKSFAVVFGQHAGQFLQLFDTKTLREKTRLDAKPFTLEHLAFSPDGRRLAIKDWPRIDRDKHPCQVRVLDVAAGKEVTPENKIRGRFSHWQGNDAIVVTEGADSQKADWVVVDAARGKERERMPIPKNIKMSIYDPAWSRAPRHMVLTNEDRYGLRVPRDDDYGKMFLADWPNGQRIRPLVFSKVDDPAVSLRRDVSLSPDERLVIATSLGEELGHTCIFLEAATGRERFAIEPKKPDEFISAAFSPDGRLIVLLRENSFALLDSLTFEPLMEFAPPYGYCVAFSANGKIMVTNDRSSLLVWDLKATLRPRKISAEKLTDGQLGALWSDLESDDAKIGHRALVALSRRPDEAVAYLKSRLPRPPPDAETFKRLVRDLGAPDFKTREAASFAIARMGESAGALLREALRYPPSFEAKRRLTTLAEKLIPTIPQRVRWLRCIELLERIGTQEARAALEFSRAAFDPELSADAARALERLASLTSIPYSGGVPESPPPGDTWSAIDAVLKSGHRALPRTTRARLLRKHKTN